MPLQAVTKGGVPLRHLLFYQAAFMQAVSILPPAALQGQCCCGVAVMDAGAAALLLPTSLQSSLISPPSTSAASGLTLNGGKQTLYF